MKKVEAMKLSFKQANEGNVICFRISPNEVCHDLDNMPLGTIVMLEVETAEIGV